MVRDQFDGSPSKTIGDADKRVFTVEASKVEAALAMDEALASFDEERGDPERVQPNIGVHRDPVIAVTLYGRIDYSGRPANIEFRTQSASAPRHPV